MRLLGIFTFLQIPLNLVGGITWSSSSKEEQMIIALKERNFVQAAEMSEHVDFSVCDEQQVSLFHWLVKAGNDQLIGRVFQQMRKAKDKKKFKSLMHKKVLTPVKISNVAHEGALLKIAPHGLLILKYYPQQPLLEIKTIFDRSVATLDHGKIPHDVQWSPDGTTLITMSGSLIKIWKEPSWQCVETIEDSVGVHWAKMFQEIAWNKTGSLFAVITYDIAARFYNNQGHYQGEIKPGFPFRMTWCSDDIVLFVEQDERKKDKQIKLWNINENVPIKSGLRREDLELSLLSPYLQYFIKEQSDGTVIFFDFDGVHIKDLIHRGHGIISAWDLEGMYFLTARNLPWDYSTIKIWDDNLNLVKTFYMPHPVRQVIWNPQGHSFLVRYDKGFEVKYIYEKQKQFFPQMEVLELGWFVDGNGFFTSDRNGITVWDKGGTPLDWASRPTHDYGDMSVLQLLLNECEQIRSIEETLLPGLCFVASTLKDSNREKYALLFKVLKEAVDKGAKLASSTNNDEASYEHEDQSTLNSRSLKKLLADCFSTVRIDLEEHFYEMIAQVLQGCTRERIIELCRLFRKNAQTRPNEILTEEHVEKIFEPIIPPLAGRLALLSYYLEKTYFADTLNREFINRLAQKAENCSWEDLKFIVTEAERGSKGMGTYITVHSLMRTLDQELQERIFLGEVVHGDIGRVKEALSRFSVTGEALKKGLHKAVNQKNINMIRFLLDNDKSYGQAVICALMEALDNNDSVVIDIILAHKHMDYRNLYLANVLCAHDAELNDLSSFIMIESTGADLQRQLRGRVGRGSRSSTFQELEKRAIILLKYSLEKKKSLPSRVIFYLIDCIQSGELLYEGIRFSMRYDNIQMLALFFDKRQAIPKASLIEAIKAAMRLYSLEAKEILRILLQLPLLPHEYQDILETARDIDKNSSMAPRIWTAGSDNLGGIGAEMRVRGSHVKFTENCENPNDASTATAIAPLAQSGQSGRTLEEFVKREIELPKNGKMKERERKKKKIQANSIDELIPDADDLLTAFPPAPAAVRAKWYSPGSKKSNGKPY